jgi:LysM repeat protein
MGFFDDIKNKVTGNDKPEDKIKAQLEAAGIDADDLEFKMKGSTLVISGTVTDDAQAKKLAKAIATFSAYMSIENKVEVADEDEDEDEDDEDDEDEEEEVVEHIVKKGETPWGIAEEYYGDGNKYKILEEYNGFTGHINVGQVILVPALYAYVGGAKLQLILNSVGYSVGKVDGQVGPNTVAALKKFQKAYQLKVTGTVDEDTALELRSAFAEEVTELSPLAVQMILTDAGYDVGGIDGTMGPKTKLALRNFQEDNELEGSGRLDEETIEALVDSYV